MARLPSNKAISWSISTVKFAPRGSTRELRRFSEKSLRETYFGQATSQSKSDADPARSGPGHGEASADDLGPPRSFHSDYASSVSEGTVYANHAVIGIA